MAFIKCKMCGGDVDVQQGATWGTCDFCGCKVTFPKDSSDQRVNLFNRADAFRRQNEFDKAISAYEKILEDDQTDAEAHWGAAISRFGIEYVENPVTFERKPTLHRLQTTSILADEDYKAAIENAPDEETRKLYEQQAQEIADIQKKVLEQSEREEQYDIFLSYKETDANGERTHDSVLAFEVYNTLTREGYNVFYAKESLKGRLGDEYEPIIFSALRSAQVMVLIGTKKEYFEAEWVRNEWTRYLDIMKQEKDKPQDEQIPRQLIPCYRDMDAYELPVELNMLQSMNMNSLGFLQELSAGIKKIMEGATQNSYVGKTDEISRLLQRAMNQSELGEFGRADALAEKVLELDPNNATAQMVKLLVQLKVNTPDELVKQKQPLTHNRLYIMACRNAKGAQKKRYESYNKKIISNLETAEKQKNLDKVLNTIKGLEAKEKKLSKDDDSGFRALSKSFDEQADLLEKMGDFGGAAEKAKEYHKHAEDIEKEIKVRIDERQRRLEEELAQKRAIEEQAKREREEKERAEREAQRKKEEAERQRLAKIRRHKAHKRLAIFLVILAIAGAITAYKMFFEDKFAYTSAVNTIEESDSVVQLDYSEEVLDRLGSDYEDVKQRQAQIAADRRFLNNDQQGAYKAYLDLDPKYRTPAKLSWYEQQYQTGESLIAQKKFDDAIALFSGIGYYQDLSSPTGTKDAQEQILRAYAEKGYEKLRLGQYEEALISYNLAGNYKDTAERIAQTQAAMLFQQGQYEEAYHAYHQLDAKYFTSDHRSWYDQLYNNAKFMLDSGDYENAIVAFENIRYYSEGDRVAEEQLKAAHYSYAKDLMIEQRVSEAIEQYRLAVPYSNSESLIGQLEADALYDAGKYAEAYERYMLLDEKYRTHKDDYRKLYDDAKDLLEKQGNIKEAIHNLEMIAYMDSDDYPIQKMLNTAYITYARSLLTPAVKIDNAKVIEAAKYFALAEIDGSQELNQYYYLSGQSALENDDPESAKEAFSRCSGFEDTEEQINNYYYKKGIAALEAGAQKEARAALEQVPGYKDAASYISRIDAFENAEKLLRQQKLSEARKAFLQVGDYLGASQLAEQCSELMYQKAKNMSVTERLAVYEELGDYADCKALAEGIMKDYNTAKLAFAAENYEDAISLFGNLGDYKDSAEMYQNSLVGRARAMIKKGNYPEGIKALQQLDPALLDEHEIENVKIAYADSVKSEGKIFEALELYRQIEGYSKEQLAVHMEAAEASLTDEKKVAEIYASLNPDTHEHDMAAYFLAQAAGKAGYTDSAIRILKELGDFSDSHQQLAELAYQKGMEYQRAFQYAQSLQYLELAKGYKDADSKLQYGNYAYANELLARKEYEKALGIYDSLGDYLNSIRNAQKCRDALNTDEQAADEAETEAAETEAGSTN